MAFTEKLPEWQAEGIEPPDSKKQTGWEVEDKPPAGWWNWILNRTFKVLEELRNKAADKEYVDNAVAGVKVDVPDASLTVKGVVQLSNATNGIRENVAPTEKALGIVMQEAQAAKQQASDGKGKVRDSITGVKGTVADADGDGIPTYDELVAGVQSIPAGFTADATVAAGDIRSGKTAYKSGTKVTGTLVTQATGAQTVTPGASNIVKPAGIYDGAITILGDADLVATNIRNGVNIFGITGNLVEGKKYFEADVGTVTNSAYKPVDVGFVPFIVVVLAYSSSDTSSRDPYYCIASQQTNPNMYGYTTLGRLSSSGTNGIDITNIYSNAAFPQILQLLARAPGSSVDRTKVMAWGR